MKALALIAALALPVAAQAQPALAPSSALASPANSPRQPQSLPSKPAPASVRRPDPEPVVGPRRLEGPRTGVTVLSPRLVQKINEALDPACTEVQCDDPTISEASPVITQLGWQFERRVFQTDSGLTGLTEAVLLVGGAERGLFLPSGTLLAGLRTVRGLEVGVGPNVSLSGLAYAAAVGVNTEFGEVNVPLNLAVVLGGDGPRASLLVGFNLSDRRW